MSWNRDEKLELVRDWFYAGTSFEAWFAKVTQHVTPDMEVCEIGSGSGKGFQNQQYPNAKFIFGLDLDPRVLQNPFLHKAVLGSALDLPKLAEGRKFDLIYSHMVVEHIDQPLEFISAQVECLKANGTISHSTVSKYYWSSLINNLVPDRIKDLLIEKLGSGRTSEDTFPAHYRLNSEADIARIAKTLGLSYSISRSDQAPGYLRRSLILMLIYTIIHKPLQYFFPALRPTLIYSFKKLPI
jgi:2-polyprenyl-3-methyl-5-hydroxy-6-metoxy-1,4-benzoquinol methylase